MTYVSLYYFIFVGITLIIYYILPVKLRWCVVLAANAFFYFYFCKKGWWIFLVTILVSYLAGLLIDRSSGTIIKRLVLFIAIISVIFPWLLLKYFNGMVLETIITNPILLAVPIGISFYTLQIIAYLADIYSGKTEVEKNLAKYMLFISYFPQLIQGPIPRYNQLKQELFGEKTLNEKLFSQGFCYILWGFFLKMVIADKAGIIVDTVFENCHAYTGTYIWIASFLYSIQLYADFLACTTLAQGVSKLFGIELGKNFEQPYFAVSVKDFWRRWHISLSTWLRDYIYIPLGGNRKGNMKKYSFLLITFVVSGIWHGSGYKFIFWGLMHALYQIIGEMTKEMRDKAYSFLNISASCKKLMKQIGTFFLINLAWVIFRANSLRDGLALIRHMFTDYNPWVLFDDSIFSLGLIWKEMLVLVIAIIILFYVGLLHEKKESVSDRILNEKLPVRWIIYILAILFIVVFGSYGFGFDANDFIYGGF